VPPVQATRLTRTKNEPIWSPTIEYCKIYEQSTTVNVFLGDPRLRHPTLIHIGTTYIKKPDKFTCIIDQCQIVYI
jgi:hypothetical protein